MVHLYYTSIAGNTPIFASFLIITLVCFIMIFKSRHGRAILAIREDEIAAEASGIPVKNIKSLLLRYQPFLLD